jgi:hypothetical protein
MGLLLTPSYTPRDTRRSRAQSAARNQARARPCKRLQQYSREVAPEPSTSGFDEGLRSFAARQHKRYVLVGLDELYRD